MDQNEKEHFSFTTTELVKLSLSPGEILAVKVISDEVDGVDLHTLREKLGAVFPSNKVMVFCVPTGGDIVFTAIKPSTELNCGPQTCVDCNCGKGNKNGS